MTPGQTERMLRSSTIVKSWRAATDHTTVLPGSSSMSKFEKYAKIWRIITARTQQGSTRPHHDKLPQFKRYRCRRSQQNVHFVQAHYNARRIGVHSIFEIHVTRPIMEILKYNNPFIWTWKPASFTGSLSISKPAVLSNLCNMSPMCLSYPTFSKLPMYSLCVWVKLQIESFALRPNHFHCRFIQAPIVVFSRHPEQNVADFMHITGEMLHGKAPPIDPFSILLDNCPAWRGGRLWRSCSWSVMLALPSATSSLSQIWQDTMWGKKE